MGFRTIIALALLALAFWSGCAKNPPPAEKSEYRSAFWEHPQFFEKRWGIPRKITPKGNVLIDEWTVENIDITIEFHDRTPYRMVFAKKSISRWTDAQLLAVLTLVANQWERVNPSGAATVPGVSQAVALLAPDLDISTYRTPDGAEARRVLNRVEVQSPELVDEIRVKKEADERRRNAVPKL